MYQFPRIIFDAERMKYPYTGLNSFCHYLGNSLKNQLEKTQNVIEYYIPKNKIGIFGNEAHYLKQNTLHKFYLPLGNKNAIWHNTYQNSNYFPSNSNTKILLTIHDLNFIYDSNKSSEKKKNYLKNIQNNINKSSHIVTISKSTLADVQAYLNIQNKEVSVIYNGCSLQKIELIETPKKPIKNNFLFTIGTIVQKKNFHVLPSLLLNNKMELVIAGITESEDYKKEILKAAQKFGVKDRVIFTGAISENDKQWYYKNCTAFVFPSLSEGFGLPVIEAMSFGKPVILSKLTCLPEIGGNEAYYFDNFEPHIMQKNMIEALHDFETNKKSSGIMAKANLYSWENAAKEYIKVYESIINNKNG